MQIKKQKDTYFSPKVAAMTIHDLKSKFFFASPNTVAYTAFLRQIFKTKLPEITKSFSYQLYSLILPGNIWILAILDSRMIGTKNNSMVYAHFLHLDFCVFSYLLWITASKTGV